MSSRPARLQGQVDCLLSLSTLANVPLKGSRYLHSSVCGAAYNLHARPPQCELLVCNVGVIQLQLRELQNPIAENSSERPNAIKINPADLILT